MNLNSERGVDTSLFYWVIFDILSQIDSQNALGSEEIESATRENIRPKGLPSVAKFVRFFNFADSDWLFAHLNAVYGGGGGSRLPPRAPSR